MKNYMVLACCLYAILANAEDIVSVREGTIELPTYEISAPEKSPVFDCKWSYQRARRSIYPYALNDNLYAQKSEKKTWKALYLENEWVKLCVLPEVGGRLFYAIDKTNGYDIFYRQDAIKPANVGMNGAWISGGVEWNVFHHHRISTQMPCNYRLVKNADGSSTIWLGETERRHRMEWTIGITLRPGSSCMEIDGRLVNCTEDSNSMLFWANVATHANPDYQIIFPQNTEFAAYHAKSSICHWPICREPFTNVDAYTNNVDVSWWKNHTVGNSLFAWELPENFIGGYDHGRDAGTMLVGNRHIIRGGKFWSWGPNSGWPTKILTDARGHYVELMVGAYTDSQPDYNWSAPGETKVFKQYWYGVRNLKGIKMGDENAALNMEKTADGKLFLAVNGTRKLDLTVAVERGGEGNAVYTQGISVAPDSPWSTTIDADGEETDYTMLVIDSRANRRILSYTPVKHDLSKPCPAEVKAPKRPKEIASTEECYYVGLRAEQFHQPYVDANDYYEEVLRRDPLDVRANTRLGVYYRRHWDLEKAEKHLRAALVRQTKDYTRVKDGEAMYNLGLVLAEKGDVDGAIDCLYRAVWTYEYNSAANLKLARIYSAKGDFKMALDRVNEAIDYNAHNLDALCLKATLLRSMAGDDLRAFREREKLLADILAFDPLNAYALYEKNVTMLSDDPEYALELALKFKANGFGAKCREILEAADRNGAHPAVKLHLGRIGEFLKMDLVDWRPFRRETKDLLEKLVAEHSEATSAWYALGNVYGNVDTAKAMSAWSKSVEQSNNQTIFPYALRNLGYGHWKWTRDYAKALSFYRMAIAAKPNEAFFLEEFDHVAEEAKLPMTERYAMLKAHHETVGKRSGALTSEIVAGIACKDYDRVLTILRTKYIPTFEGAANMHDIYVDALLGKAAELENAGDVKGALALYEETENYPANQQVFVEFTKRRPRDAQVWYRMGCAYEKAGDAPRARSYFGKSAAVDTLRTDYCYEKALSLLKLGRVAETRAIGEAMVKKGSVVLDDYVDFFDYEGNRYGSTRDAKNAAAAKTRRLGEDLLRNAGASANGRSGSSVPERKSRPVGDVRPPAVGGPEPRTAPDPNDDQWMIGCELLDRDFTKFSAYKDYLPKLGIRSIRLQGGWAKCEKAKGVYDFSWLDEPVDFALAHGLNPVLETGYGNPLYKGGGGRDLAGGFPHGEEGLAAWDRWVDALSRHFAGRVRDWAMWNEPDIGNPADTAAVGGHHTPEAIAAFNVRTAKIIRKNIPNARIAGLSLATNDPGFHEACYKALGADIGLFWRFIYHGYEAAPEKSYDNVKALKAVCAKYAPHATLWQGENGAPSEMPGDGLALHHIAWSEISQAKWDMRRMIGDYVHGVPSSVFTICDYFHPGRGIGPYGLLRADSAKNVIAEKLAFGAVRNVVRTFDKDMRRVPCSVSSPERSLQLHEFRRKGRPLFVFWTCGQFEETSEGWEMRYQRPSDGSEKHPVVIEHQDEPLAAPVVIDLLTGAVEPFPQEHVLRRAGGTTYVGVPAYDSPCLLTERAAIEFR